MKKALIKGQKGFTLMELLMVVAIIGLLMGIVAPKIVDSRSAAGESQVKADGNATNNAQKKYNNDSTNSASWPELAFDAIYHDPAGGSRVFYDTEGTEITAEGKNSAEPTGITQPTGVSNFGFNHTDIDFAAATTIWLDDGSLETAVFVPGFLPKEPPSVILQNTEGLVDSSGAPLLEFVWLLRVNSPGTEAESREVEVYRLDRDEGTATAPVAVYVQVF